MAIWRSRCVLAAVAAAVLTTPAAALAAPPNDDRGQPAELALRSATEGTLADATLEDAASPVPGAAPVADACDRRVVGDVWYSVGAPRGSAPVILRLAGSGLDAVLTVEQVTPTGTRFLKCDATDRDDRAGVRVNVPSAGGRFLVRVALEDTESEARGFRLTATPAPPPPAYPGRRVPARGAAGSVDSLANTADAWSSILRSGTTYRVNLAHSPTRCASLRIFSPRASWNEAPSYGRPCGGYLLVTPGPGLGGRWTFRVETSGQRREQQYRLSVAPAGRDDMAPGLLLRDRRTMRGRVTGGAADAVDLYRIDIEARSHVSLRLRTGSRNGFNLRLLSIRGRTVSCACGERGNVEVRKGLHRGRYYLEVRARHRARGSYSLRRVDRALTGTSLRVEGQRRVRLAPGEAAALTVNVRPSGVSGAADIRIERFDPLSGWHFVRQTRLRVRRGRASMSFTPPAEGTWRAMANFRGTNRASPSDSRWVRMVVQAPLGRT
jgi:hypothetical protein